MRSKSSARIDAPVSGTSSMQMESKQPRVHRHDSAMKIAHPEHAQAPQVRLSTRGNMRVQDAEGRRQQLRFTHRPILDAGRGLNVSSCFCKSQFLGAAKRGSVPTFQICVSPGRCHRRFTTAIRLPQANPSGLCREGACTHPLGALHGCSDAVEIYLDIFAL